MKRVSVLIAILILITMNSFAAQVSVEKQACVLISENADKNMSQIQELLLSSAKRAALSEIYGEYIKSKTLVQDYVLSFDSISATSAGMVRIDGDPNFYNGSNFGEACVKIKAYATDEDLQQFNPEQVTVNNYCFNDPSVPLGEVKQKAREGAFVQVLVQRNPTLKDISPEEASILIRNFQTSNEQFNFNTGAMCMDIKGEVIPFELENFTSNMDSKDAQKATFKPGDTVFEFDPSIYEQGTPMTEISKLGIILVNKGGKKFLGTTFSGNDIVELNVKNITTNFKLETIQYSNSGYLELESSDGKTFMIKNRENTLTLSNGMEVGKSSWDDGYYFTVTNGLVKFYENGKFLGSYNQDIKDIVKIRFPLNSRRAYYGLKITAL